jgi:hypothetical protein
VSGRSQQSPAERARRSRNIALALVLAGFAVLFFVMTIVRLGGQVAL